MRGQADDNVGISITQRSDLSTVNDVHVFRDPGGKWLYDLCLLTTETSSFVTRSYKVIRRRGPVNGTTTSSKICAPRYWKDPF
jgi:hypothetical protein